MYCYNCEPGAYKDIVVDYDVILSGGVHLQVPGVRLLRCESCGDELIPPKAQLQIDEAVLNHKQALL